MVSFYVGPVVSSFCRCMCVLAFAGALFFAFFNRGGWR